MGFQDYLGVFMKLFFMILVCSMTLRHIWINYSCVLTNVKKIASPLIWISACSWCAWGHHQIICFQRGQITRSKKKFNNNQYVTTKTQNDILVFKGMTQFYH